MTQVGSESDRVQESTGDGAGGSGGNQGQELSPDQKQSAETGGGRGEPARAAGDAVGRIDGLVTAEQEASLGVYKSLRGVERVAVLPARQVEGGTGSVERGSLA